MMWNILDGRVPNYCVQTFLTEGTFKVIVYYIPSPRAKSWIIREKKRPKWIHFSTIKSLQVP
jgi:hypothetical protein